MIFAVDVFSALFAEAVLFDFATGNARGALTAEGTVANLVEGYSVETDAAVVLQDFFVFGILGAAVSTMTSLFVIFLFEKAMVLS